MVLRSLFTRRRLILNSSAALLAVHAEAAERNPFAAVAGRPDSVAAFTESGEVPLKREGSTWQGENGVQVGTDAGVTVRCPRGALLRIRLRWQLVPAAALRYAGDHWERSYGDLAWRHMEPERILPWYFLATGGKATHACGVKTAPAAFCFLASGPQRRLTMAGCS